MKMNIVSRFLLILGLMAAVSEKSFGATAADYANAGLQLYNQKNYSQSIQYYNAAISLDPNNGGALQGRANDYYALGQYPQALEDYQKVQALTPSPELSQFIQALQAKVGSAPAAPPLATGASFDQGVALYQQKQYAAAVPMFQRAAQENPSDSKSYYYLGLTEMMLGDNKNAALNLFLSDKKQPNPSVAAYAGQLKARLSPEDQQWVDGQLTASSPAPSAGSSNPGAGKNLGVRFSPGFLMATLSDFQTNAESLKTALTSLQSFDPSLTYTGIVPTGAINMEIQPVLKLGGGLEIGLPVGVLPVGTASDAVSDSTGNRFTDSFDITAISVGLNLRYAFGSGDFQPFVGAGGLIEPISIQWSETQPGSSTTAGSGTFSGMGVGGQVMGGVDWHLGDTFVISPFVGFQTASANLFTGSFSATVNGSVQNYNGQLDMVPLSTGGYTIFADSDNFTPPAGTRPLQIDLSGIKAGVGIAAFF